MRISRFHCVLFLFVLLSYALFGCSIAKKNKDKRVVGAWNMVNVYDITSTTIEQWIFDADGKVYRMEVTDSGSALLDDGEWAITQKMSTAHLNTVFESVGSTQAGFNVLWEILSLKKNTMILTNEDGGLLTREFERAK